MSPAEISVKSVSNKHHGDHRMSPLPWVLQVPNRAVNFREVSQCLECSKFKAPTS